MLEMGAKSSHHVYNISDRDNIPWNTHPVMVNVNDNTLQNAVRYDESLPNISTPVYFSDDFRMFLTF